MGVRLRPEPDSARGIRAALRYNSVRAPGTFRVHLRRMFRGRLVCRWMPMARAFGVFERLSRGQHRLVCRLEGQPNLLDFTERMAARDRAFLDPMAQVRDALIESEKPKVSQESMDRIEDMTSYFAKALRRGDEHKIEDSDYFRKMGISE